MVNGENRASRMMGEWNFASEKNAPPHRASADLNRLKLIYVEAAPFTFFLWNKSTSA